jgi:LPXTG-motif cell wall-anchored protein
MDFTEGLKIFLLAMTPIGELRAALPTALAVYHLNWPIAYFISVIGNLVPVVFLLLFLEPVSSWFSRKSNFFQRFFSWLFEKTRKNSHSKMKKYGYLALIPFVAIPLPITGGWTGSIIAFLYQIPFKLALPLIALGVMIAGIVVLFATKAGITVEKYFGWPVLLGALLVLGLGWYSYNRKKKYVKEI